MINTAAFERSLVSSPELDRELIKRLAPTKPLYCMTRWACERGIYSEVRTVREVAIFILANTQDREHLKTLFPDVRQRIAELFTKPDVDPELSAILASLIGRIGRLELAEKCAA